MIDHDRLFKELITTFFLEFVDLMLPEIGSCIDLTSIQFLDKEIFTDVTEGERIEADVVVRARFKDQDACFLVHSENQAQTQVNFGRRMFRYFARLYEKHGLPVYPVVVFSHDGAKPEAADFCVRFPDLDVLRFQFQSIQLRRLPWRDFVRKPNPVAAALMSQMEMTSEERPRVKLECLRLMTTLRLNPARMKLISGFVDTYLRLSQEETLQFMREADTLLTVNERSKMFELTTSWKEEGLQEGRREECLRLVRRLLARRLGLLDASIASQIEALPLDRLEALAEATLDFSSRENLTVWLSPP